MINKEYVRLERRVRGVVEEVYQRKEPLAPNSPKGRLLLKEDGCVGRDMRGVLLEREVKQCLDRATGFHVLATSDDPTCVDDIDAVAMLFHVALRELIITLGGELAGEVLVELSEYARSGPSNFRESVLNIIDNAAHDQDLT
ncbi:hypothetical protein [Methylobacterium crusticola]|uniref:hypothetical protein n=1 Tax=Methylobacterium crusticola TaxID=1697972 RepID=UPI000FFB4625|nr:hypothetical protein [Methylobacterium crusticola]